MNNLSAIVVTYNEEKNLKDCLESLCFADEVIVVDSDSSDNTARIAEDMGAVVLQTDIQYPEEKKNIGISRASFPWIFVLDADERVTRELRDEIKKELDNPDCDGYYIYRKNFFLGKEIKHCGWNADRVMRLFKKDKGVYPDKRVHGKLQLDGKEGYLNSKIEHHSYCSVNDYFVKINRYTLWSAKDLKGKKVTAVKLVLNPVFRFIRMYILRLGFLDGVYGLILCIMASFSVFIKYLRIYLNTEN
ncbi:MAG: glycosyltransferase family 2 protein [Elusimicrobiota bacterium]